MLHDDELALGPDVVRALLTDTAPDLADLPLRRLAAAGSSNALYRLGDDLLVRLPRQPGGTETIEKEARWSPLIAAALPVAVPEVVLVGEPGHGYPERWSMVRWLDGEPPVVRRGGGSVEPGDLAALVGALRTTAVPPVARADAALQWYRGDRLADLLADGREALAGCRGLDGLGLDVDLDVDAALALWECLAATPQGSRVSWVHADLLAENLLVREDRLTAVLDLGGLAVGHPEVDLVGAWELLDREGRADFRALLDIEDDEWLLGAGWALLIAAITLPYYWHTMPARCADRLVMARAVLEELG